MESFSHFIDSYEMSSDFTQIRGQVNETKMQIQWELDSLWHENEKELREKEKSVRKPRKNWRHGRIKKSLSRHEVRQCLKIENAWMN